MLLPMNINVNPILSRLIMPSAPIAHRGSGSTLETSPLPVLLYQTHVVQQEVHSVPGSRSERRIFPLVELSRRLLIQRDFKYLST